MIDGGFGNVWYQNNGHKNIDLSIVQFLSMKIKQSEYTKYKHKG